MGQSDPPPGYPGVHTIQSQPGVTVTSTSQSGQGQNVTVVNTGVGNVNKCCKNYGRLCAKCCLTHFQSPYVLTAVIRPASYLAMSVLTFFFCNWFLGLIAIIFSGEQLSMHASNLDQEFLILANMFPLFVVMSSSAADDGNLEGARKHGRVAFWLNISSYIVFVVAVIAVVIFLIAASAAREDDYEDYD